MKSLALATLLAALLAMAHAALGSRLSEYHARPHNRKLLAPLVPGLGGSSGSNTTSGNSTSPSSGKAGGKASSDVVTTSIAYGTRVVACKEWDPDTASWDFPDKPTEYKAKGGATPPADQVKSLASLICSDPEAAGAKIRPAVQKGGADAQAAVAAIFSADCSDEQAPGDAYGAAIDAVNTGDPATVDETSSWLANLAAAADAVGVPLCVSLAVVDPSTGEASNSKEFHTGA